jgi:hypothetical protein
MRIELRCEYRVFLKIPNLLRHTIEGSQRNLTADLTERQNWYSTNIKNLLTYDSFKANYEIYTSCFGQEANDNHGKEFLPLLVVFKPMIFMV